MQRTGNGAFRANPFVAPVNSGGFKGSTQPWLAVYPPSLKSQRFSWTLIETRSDLHLYQMLLLQRPVEPARLIGVDL